MSTYVELQDSSGMSPGSLNSVVRDVHRLRRPPSLSDSFVLSPSNIERASSFQAILPIHTSVVPKENVFETQVLITLLRFLFHITLISMFETIFFFHYVSALEDNGIQSTIENILSGTIQSCRNLTIAEQIFINTNLGPYFNLSSIFQNGASTYQLRMRHNASLYLQSWMYVLCISGSFLVCLLVSQIRKRNIEIRTICLDNLGFVTMLGLYEIMFFHSIVFTYSPISSQEVVANILVSVQSNCHIL
jgi:hypothetical protein